MADDFDRFAFNREANDWDEFSSLGALDDAPPPNPRFVRALRGELMDQAVSMSGSAMIRGHMATTAGSLSAPLPTPIPVRTRFDRRLRFELAAVAILLLSLIGSISLYDNSGTGNTNNILNGLATQSTDDSDQPFALYRQDAARTGISLDEGPLSLPGSDWRINLTNPNLVPVLAVDGVIYLVDDEGGEVQALSASTGQPFWSANVGRMISPSIAVANGYVFASTEGPGRQGSDPGYLVALNRGTGSERWRYESGGSSSSAPVVDDGRVYMLSNDGTLRVVDAETGAESWRLELGGAESATPFPELARGFGSNFSPAIANGNVYVTNDDGVIYAINLETHQEKWRFRTDGNVLSTPTVRDGQVYLAATWVQDGTDTTNGSMYRIDANTGDVSWSVETGDFTSIAAVSNDYIYSQVGSILHIMDASTGETLWANTERNVGEPLITADAVYLSNGEGNVLGLGAEPAGEDTTPLWSVYLGELVYGMVVLDGKIYVHTTSGTLISLSVSGSDIATPSTESAGATADLSGLPDCQAPAPIDWQSVSGEPASTLVPLVERSVQGTPRSDHQDYGQQPSLGFEDVPVGDTVDSGIQQGILLALHDIGTCNQVGRTDDVSGFFSEDFYRRHWVQAQFEMNAQSPAWFLNFLPENALNYTSIVKLPDGRVSVFVKINEMNGAVIVFVEVDGRWVIDELVAIVPVPGAMG